MNNINEIMDLNPKKASILIVDDEYANVRVLEKLLTNQGYINVISTQDPTQTVSLYQEYKSDLILLDLNMPTLDGYGVMEQLNQVTDNNLPAILILTAQHEQNFRQKALDNGARDYVTKPFDACELLSRVRNLLAVQVAQKFMRSQNEILEYKVKERTQELIATRLQIVHHLGRAAEYRDNETGLHIIRMSKIAVVLAQAYGLNEQECDLLLNAAPMHDIGKIGIPDRILLKQGKLNDEEWPIMQTHAQIGADVLGDDDSQLIVMAQQIAISHHEKWDGTGYPKGLKGDEIPLMGRICALADVFDALSSKRPYKEAWPLDKSLSLIKQESGKHFEPKLVALFLQNLDEILEIRQKFSEPESK
ncbi:HD domain-containing phosphohydrolase [Pseudoalteromonas denitrificans]|uniref:Putative two-component system response regulator n=1 Tax=Pseudoalteromonas denitrificans DSM 6059 TaxID=1123010 RepID=A0A1I1PR11_9GAMM|nr:HD domain-containing phosphohydrolase [Pseudoalteromonas denitrificans]SFD12112.1 putative two-component system response regulator [Pseudoalteromonas denitrificans DSM 6059]